MYWLLILLIVYFIFIWLILYILNIKYVYKLPNLEIWFKGWEIYYNNDTTIGQLQNNGNTHDKSVIAVINRSIAK